MAKSSGYGANIADMMRTHINTLDAVQGVRIDYALCSAGLVDKVVSCEIVSTPPKWSDHAAITLGEADDRIAQSLQLFAPTPRLIASSYS